MESTALKSLKYSLAHFNYRRIPTREVNIGGVAMGGNNPIRIQSMTTTDTMDTLGTVEQSIRLVEAGCDYVRITAPSKKEAENLGLIKKELRKRGYNVPLVADIHFTPNAAEIAARLIEKVRVNPGNYADKKRFQAIEYTDASYQAELERIDQRFSPLVKICKEHGTVMRIGTNHGSLSDRIMSRYGDTPLGMVESAMEFVRICENHGYHDLVISMKASNPQVMVQAYRMLMSQMLELDMVYPLHLGVTEAGEGEDGRIKSALGIATLLMDGIGDTVRVSLTEEPEYEAPVAQFLVNQFVEQGKQDSGISEPEKLVLPFDPYQFKRSKRTAFHKIGGEQVPRVITDLSGKLNQASDLSTIGYSYVAALDKYNFSDQAADYVYLGAQIPAFELPGGLSAVLDYSAWKLLRNRSQFFPLFTSISALKAAKERSEELNFVRVSPDDEINDLQAMENVPMTLVLASQTAIKAYAWRSKIYQIHAAGIHAPIILMSQRPEAYDFFDDRDLPEYIRLGQEAKSQLLQSAEMSSLLVDGLVDGMWLEKCDEVMMRTAFGMLQLARLRITKTEYISCPSCGRTLFDLQETTARIRSRTEHLKGVKIGIMGCIVNGPGEMADADYGYVGMGPGKIALYRGQEVVDRSVPTDIAVDALIDLIREDGNWLEPA